MSDVFWYVISYIETCNTFNSQSLIAQTSRLNSCLQQLGIHSSSTCSLLVSYNFTVSR